MAERRMFAKTIVDSDDFLDMPMSSQLLYFHLAMRADDDGFINKPKSIMRMCGCKDDDMKVLFARQFVIPFDTGIVVIRHWKIHNYIRKDTYTETQYLTEKSQLILGKNDIYEQSDTELLQLRDESVTGTSTQVRLDKVRGRIGELSEGKKNKEKIRKNCSTTVFEKELGSGEEKKILSAVSLHDVTPTQQPLPRDPTAYKLPPLDSLYRQRGEDVESPKSEAVPEPEPEPACEVVVLDSAVAKQNDAFGFGEPAKQITKTRRSHKDPVAGWPD